MNYFDFRERDGLLKKFDEIDMLNYTNRPMAADLEEHTNDGIEFCVAQYGIFEWVVEGKDARIKNGEISITLPWQRHSGKESVINKGKLAFIIIKPHIFEKNGHLDFGARLPLLETIQDELGMLMISNESVNIGKSQHFSNLLLTIGKEIREGKVGYETAVYLCLSQMMVEVYRLLLEKKQVKEGEDDCVNRAIREINEKLDDPWSNSKLESITGLKKTALNKRFKAATGYAPMNYVMNQKISYSKKLIKQGTSITNIAHELNFSSSQHFSSVFKKYTGVTPRTYQKRVFIRRNHETDIK